MTATWQHLRVFLVGGLIAYRALFSWIRPAIYIPTMLGSPLFQILFFAHLGRFSGLEDDTFFVIGNALQASAMSSVYGMTMGIANERQFATLSSLLATPANRAALFLGRALPFVANGLGVSAFGLGAGVLLLDVRLAPGSLPALTVVALITVASCTALGMVLGSLALWTRDVLFVSNLAYFLMLLLCGVNVPLERLPGWVQALGAGLPLTHGLAAARAVAAGSTLAEVAGLGAREALTGAAWAAAALLLLRLFESEGRRRASFERM